MRKESQILVTSTSTRGDSAFTLLEVMIAVAIFFMATFSILALVSRCLAQARALQPMQVDANMVAAELSLTNRLEEGPVPPEIIAHFEHLYPNYTATGFITEIGTNGFFQVDVEVAGLTSGKHIANSKSTVYLFRQSTGRGRLPGLAPR
ncbi:MAG TPA: prepilin-type N-terminal cleavage/methylation domain-containing protein [Verrucomicrobiae bacterium]|nr:prepilin-type N-terminal cleavage/methylation domain-containing protein [Verrucomicrobiae bacterium]